MHTTPETFSSADIKRQCFGIQGYRGCPTELWGTSGEQDEYREMEV